MQVRSTWAWAKVKAFVDDRDLYVHWFENDAGYVIGVVDSFVEIICEIKKGTSDATDFETNYKTAGNIPLRERSIYEWNLLKNGASSNMSVDGSTTNVNFDWAPAAGRYFIKSVNIFIAIYNGDFLRNYFGNISGGLTNGLRLRIQSNGTFYTVGTFKDNIDLKLSFPAESHQMGGSTANNFGIGTAVSQYYAQMNFEGDIVVRKGASDLVRVIVRDDLTPLAAIRMSVFAATII